MQEWHLHTGWSTSEQFVRATAAGLDSGSPPKTMSEIGVE